MRAGIEGLAPPRSLAGGLPAAFFGNDFTTEMVKALDEVLAPVFANLDNLDAYFDPRYAPDDFVRWFAGWLGFAVDERWPIERIRTGLAYARDGMLWRGTLRGVRAAVRAYTGREPQLADGGGVAWSERPLGPLPGQPRSRLVVRIADPDGTIDRTMVERIVVETKPAHVRHEIVITPAGGR